jgi:hypothetical protein
LLESEDRDARSGLAIWTLMDHCHLTWFHLQCQFQKPQAWESLQKQSNAFVSGKVLTCSFVVLRILAYQYETSFGYRRGFGASRVGIRGEFSTAGKRCVHEP